MPTGNTQQVINYGATANDGQGDPLRTAFIKTDENFDNIWLAGPAGSNVRITNNTIGVIDTNGNLILSPNGVGVIQTNNNVVPRANRTYDLGSANLQYRTVYANSATFQTVGVAGDLSVSGNLTVQGNIIQVGNIVTETLTIQLANAATTANAANGAGITVGASDNIATLLYNSASNVWTTNIGVSATGNVTAPYFIGNGSQLTGITSSYGNSNVTTLLGNLGSNVISGTGNITTTANISGGNILGNGRQLTGIVSSYGNANVVANLSALGTNPISTTGNVSAGNISASGNVSGAYVKGNGSELTNLPAPTVTQDITSNGAMSIMTYDGVIKYVNYATVEPSSGNIAGGNISAIGNVAGNFFLGNGSQLTGISTADTGNVTFDDVNIIGTGNLNLQPNGSASEYLNIYLTGAADIHVAYGGGSGNVILGTDEEANVAVLQGGNVAIQAGNVAGTKTWTFDTAGNLTLPLNSVVYETNIPDGALSGSAIALKPTGGTTANQQLLIYPTANDGDHIHMTSGNLYTTELFLGSDNFYAKLANTGDIVLHANTGLANATWTFGANSRTSLPGGTVLLDSSGLGLLTSGIANATIGTFVQGADGGVGWEYQGDGADANTSYGAVALDTGGTANTANLRFKVQLVADQNDPSTNKEWLFDTSGNLTLPGNTFAVNYANGTAVSLGGSSYGNANVVANLAALGSNPISTTGNITAGNFVGNGAALSNVTISLAGNVVGTQANVTLVAGSYSTVFDNTGVATFPGNVITAGNISATGSILATPAWTSAGAITLTGTTTNPTKGTTTSDNISYRQLGAKQWEVVMTYIQSSGTGGATGSGDYLITLPNGLSFDTTLPSQPIYTSGVGVSTFAHLPYVIPNCNGTITNDIVGGQIFPMIYSATKFRILTFTYGSGIQCWGAGFYSCTDDPRIQLTFRFTST